MSIEDGLEDSFTSAGIVVEGINIIASSQDSFGGFVADVSSNLGRIRVTKDRGQHFIDSVEDVSTGRCLRGDSKWPELAPIYGSGNWTLMDLLLGISRQG
ncbi:MAG TPA: hypothetical protein VGO76_05505 [Luteibacter sp.]|jgi:hypothetical protein|nr:hypothetical protein [Luteibacter sp.]